MGLKQFTNSNTGRMTMLLTGLVTLGVLISGGYFAYLTYKPESSQQAMESQLKAESNGWPIEELSVGAEKDPLPQLPSTTISFKAGVSQDSVDSDALTRNPIGFPFMALYKDQLSSLMNVSMRHEPKDDDTSGAYSFKFYSDSLKDYEEGGAYELAAQQFLQLQKDSPNKLDVVSKPSPSGGRELLINARADYEANSVKSEDFSDMWKSLVNDALPDTATDEIKERVHLTLSDTNKISVTAVLSSNADRDRALKLHKPLWNTFAAYAYDSPFSFVKAKKVVYAVERTNEDSTLTVTTDPAAAKVANMKDQLVNAANDSNGELSVLWSYNTYLIPEGSSNPFFFLESTSRNW